VAPQTVVYGYTGGAEESKKTLGDNWTEGGAVISGSGDSEKITFSSWGDYATSEAHNIGVMTAVIQLGNYQAGSGTAPTIYYKTGVTKASCELDLWHTYNGVSFYCQGWVALKLQKNPS
jgi:hypothetical protein